MKLLRHGQPGCERPGALDETGRIRDLSSIVSDIDRTLLSRDCADLKGVDLAGFPEVEPETRLGSPVSGVGKFICIGLNYADHARESGATIPDEPIIFQKATSAIVGPNDDIVIPRGSRKTDWEVELGVIIGREARYVKEADALRHVAGLCVINDISEREFQLERGGQWDKGKGCDTFGPVGPYLVTLDEIPSLDELSLWLTVNGERVQNGTTADLIFKVPFLVHYVSQFMSLQPGDIISTGTPAGVGLGFDPPRYLKPGDVVELGISGLGQQRQRVRAFEETKHD